MVRTSIFAASILALMTGLPISGAAQTSEPSSSAPATTTAPVPMTDKLDQLFVQLAQADDSNWKALEDEIWELWSRSGSDAFDLLLDRGRKAMDAGDFEVAIEHLTALTDHAPDFAEGWNARATAFYLSGRLGLSLDDIARVLTLEPRHFAALSGLGIILEELGDNRGALEAYRLSLAIHPRNPRVKEAVQRLESAEGRDI
ncbi:Tetratricopeptide repeat-containing protein [Aliiroseovarius sediminilitoris]|uniref:Tetratricopeptide repeat-containing protein n=1 Tax=Aliiroseovarius sediminilitoris TaxID=1173584 RepID=A0A1I0PI97_9RHOB|nr:tetratricopeptide repeat protein [Aliiroseovarius sediminilitoris]SEW14096.1 Tetratricopeptide repeat-containing protein [Aliiroseovarius sediminilitoris]